MPKIKKISRTMMPFEDGLSPLTEKSRGVPMFGGTQSMEDILMGRDEGYNDVKARGSWSNEEDDINNYREDSDQFKINEAMERIDRERAVGLYSKEDRWVVETVDGSVYEFPSKEEAKQHVLSIKSPVRRMFKKEASKTDIIQRSLDACVKVTSMTEDGQSTGSAFCIKPHLFLTCAHVVESYAVGDFCDKQEFMSKNRAIFIEKDGIIEKAEVLGVSLDRDVALLKSNFDCGVLGMTTDIFQGEDVIIVGSPKGFENEVSEGIISGLNRSIFIHKTAPTYIFTDARTMSGNSGGPLISQVSGKVVGMMEIIVGSDDSYGLNAAIDVKSLNHAIQEINNGKQF